MSVIDYTDLVRAFPPYDLVGGGVVVARNGYVTSALFISQVNAALELVAPVEVGWMSQLNATMQIIASENEMANNAIQMDQRIIPIGTSAVLWFTGEDGETALPITAGSGTMSLKDAAGVAVTGAASIALAFSASLGKWRGVLPGSLSLTEGATYTLTVVFTGDGGQLITIRRRMQARYIEG